jgi:TRPM family ion channel
MMRTKKIDFPDQQVLCVFPDQPAELGQALSELHLNESYPVIVLIGGEIDAAQADVTRQAIQTISRIAHDMNALVICGGTDMGIMAEIGQIHSKRGYSFPLVGIAPEELVTWMDGPASTKKLWWGKQRWQLEPHYTHFILVPGSKFGDESTWIVATATLLSEGHRSVTVLINGGEVSRKDIDLSLKEGRPVIALSRSGRLADELSRNPARNKMISIAPAHADNRILDLIQAALSANGKSMPI